MMGAKWDNRLINIFNKKLKEKGLVCESANNAEGLINISIFNSPNKEYHDYFRIRINGDGITINSSSITGSSYALRTLCQIINTDRSIDQCEIEDWSSFEFRGIHLLADIDALRLHKFLINDIFTDLRINNIIYECEYVNWKSHPELHQSWGMPINDLREIIRYCKDNYIVISPLLQSYGHCEYLFKDGRNKDIAEDPENPYNYNVSNPKTWEIMTDLLTDVKTEFYESPFLHIGHDEVIAYGRYPFRPENIGRPLSDLLNISIGFFSNWAEKHNQKIMMWHDYISGRSIPGKMSDVIQSLKEVNKKITMVVWNYSDDRKFPEIDNIMKTGCNIIGATGEEKLENVINFSKYSQGKDIYGMLHTTWTGYDGNGKSVFRYPNKIWPYIQAGLSFWNPNCGEIINSVNSKERIMFDDLIDDIYGKIYRMRKGDIYYHLNISKYLDCKLDGSLDSNDEFVTSHDGERFLINRGNGHPIGILLNGSFRMQINSLRRFKAISILWANLSLDAEDKKIGEIKFYDKENNDVDIVNGREIGNYLPKEGRIFSNTEQLRKCDDNIYAVSQPVYSNPHRYSLWQYNIKIPDNVDSATISLDPKSEIVIAGINIIER